ncbi:MAG: hypothetical protein IPH06_06880 [Alphaproteobacteria bacterium]|nr:hypothetical protein [Alphaproteobacteria bacterium]QQS57739.1 MAG: hypothetical protein IPN28_02645 [Alphaproteobacteria bacterium]
MKWLDTYRLTVFVPEEALESFVKAVSPKIPAFLGNYDHVCWWSERGTEQSRESVQGKIERVPCVKFECSLPKDTNLLERFIEERVRPAHPWKEPVILIAEYKIMKNK